MKNSTMYSKCRKISVREKKKSILNLFIYLNMYLDRMLYDFL